MIVPDMHSEAAHSVMSIIYNSSEFAALAAVVDVNLNATQSATA